VILDGASVPPELRGRSWGQIKQIYGALANDFVLRQNNGGRPPAPAAPAAPVYEQGRPNGGQPPAGRTGTFWEDPEGSIARIVDARIAPITQRTSAMAIQEARNVAASGIPDWNQLEAEVLTIVAGADASSLADPRLWQSTAELARGRLMGRGQYNYAPAGREGAAPGGAPPATRGPGVFAPAQTSPVGAFFTEAPTPPQNGQDGYGAATDMASRVSNLTAEQRQYAQKMLMSLEDYVAWQGGVIQTAPVRRY
jgi:hypothetical protein